MITLGDQLEAKWLKYEIIQDKCPQPSEPSGNKTKEDDSSIESTIEEEE